MCLQVGHSSGRAIGVWKGIVGIGCLIFCSAGCLGLWFALQECKYETGSARASSQTDLY